MQAMEVSREIDHIAAKIPFQTFCDLCEKIKSCKVQKSKVEILQKYIDNYRISAAEDKSNAAKDFFPILRMLLPQAERERGPYGLKETAFARMYVRILNLPKQGHEAMKLMNYKAPSSSQSTYADFGDVAYFILKSRCRDVGKLSIQDINERLDRIALYHAENKPRNVDEEITRMVSSMTALQQKWLIRIILKDLKLGIGQAKILSTFHSDAQDLFDSCNSLSKICTTLHSPSVRLHEIEIDIFSPFRPMLSDRLDVTKINSAMKKDEEYFLESKFDGERFQIHMKDGEFKYFSRNGFDYTENYGKSFKANGFLTKYLKDVLNTEAHKFIIDGEMMGWHRFKKVFSSKGMTFDVKKITESSTFRPCFCAFDILQYNDKVLTNLPVFERLGYLDNLFIDKEGVIIHSKRVITRASDEVLAALNQAIDDQEEGIILKNVQSLYKPNSRKTGWFKIKPEYTDGVMNELDLLIIGGYFAENKRYGSVGSVLLGVAVPSHNNEIMPSMFISVGKVKLSLVADEFEDLCKHLEANWKPVNKSAECPSCVSWSKDKPDVWIEPRNSVILQIKASELVRSSAYKTEYTLRFPRIEKIRYDKPWHNCLTTLEFSELTKHSHGIEKLTARHIAGEDIEEGSSVSPRKRKKILEVGDQFRSANVSNVKEISGLFSGKEICVMTGNARISKSELEVKVVENCGRIVQNPGLSTYCILAGSINARVNNAIKSATHNVATLEWFFKALQPENFSQGKILEWRPMDLLGTSKEVAEDFAKKYDIYGDSFTKDATMESLIYSMQRVNELKEKVYLLPIEMHELDKELFEGPNPYSFMRLCNVYFTAPYSKPLLNTSKGRNIELMKTELVFYGGRISEQIDVDGITHIVITSTLDARQSKELKDQFVKLPLKPLIVNLQWLQECLIRNEHVEEEDYREDV